ncbi:hypothetical protein HanIR_Chr12g0567611 [Helianthus annuus]|nr:hypothetical protein HanIR_Chr12g0567611 [Helianthus annuus]
MAMMQKKKILDFDDDGTARTAEGRFLNLQPHFAAFLIIGKSEPNHFFFLRYTLF